MLRDLLASIILGAVQGITEYLPISSTGHLVILEHWLGLNSAQYGLQFDVFINLGTTTALILYFWRDLIQIFSQWRLPSKRNPLTQAQKLPWWIFWSTVTVGIIGLLLQDHIETTFRSLWVIAGALIGFGLVMILAEKLSQKHVHSEISAGQAYGIGIGQALALVPGVSRSGATISIGLLSGLSRIDAARYSFLLSTPITVLAIIKSVIDALPDLIQSPNPSLLLNYLVGAFVAGIFGYFSIQFLLGYLKKAPLYIFAYYRIGLGLILLALLTFTHY